MTFTEQAYCLLRTKCGSMEPKLDKQMQELQEEKPSRKRLVAGQALGIQFLREAARSFAVSGGLRTLRYLVAVQGDSHGIRSENGPEFVVNELQGWLSRAAVRTFTFKKRVP